MNHSSHVHPIFAPLLAVLRPLDPLAGPLQPEPISVSHEIAYARLLDRLAKEEPNTGWCSVSQMPLLSDDDVATVLLHEPSVAADAFVNDEVMKRLVAVISSTAGGQIPKAVAVGAVVADALASQARRYLLGVLQEMAAEETERRYAITRERGETAGERA